MPPRGPGGAGYRCSGADARQAAVSRLIQVWINRGHLLASIDPLGLMPRPRPRVLDLDYFGLSPADLDTEFITGSRTDAVPKRMKLRDILAQLQYIYAGTSARSSRTCPTPRSGCGCRTSSRRAACTHRFSAEEQRNILWQLTAAEGLERYLHTKYVGQKRFSLEGGDALHPAARRPDPARRRGRRRGSASSAWRTAAGSTCW